jgi:S-DNA-T family DNA segregation ATPase FtsK/SpoIIIE
VMISGVKGSGKTGLLLLIAVVVINSDDARGIYCDLKGGQDSRPLAGRFFRYETTVAGTVEALGWLKDELDRRAQTYQGRIWKPTPQDPAYVMFIDELAELEFAEDAWETIASINRRGRSLGVGVIGATQYPTTPPLDSQAISQMDTRFTFRLGKRRHREVSMIDYGDRDPAMFPRERPGTCYYEGRDARELSLRIRWVSDEQLAAIGAAAGDAEHLAVEAADETIPAPRGGETEQQRAVWPPDGDPDELEPVASVPGTDLVVDRADLEQRLALADSDAERVMWTALAQLEGVGVKELPKLTGRSRAWVYGRLDDWQANGTVERLRSGVYRARAREMTGADT